MGGLRTLPTARVVIAGHAFGQDLRCGHYEMAVDIRRMEQVAVAFAELALAI